MRPLGKNLLFVRAICCAVVCNSLESKQTDGAGVGQLGAATRAGVARILVTVVGLELDTQLAVTDELQLDPMNLVPVALLVGGLGLLRDLAVRLGILHVKAMPLRDGRPGIPGGVAMLYGLEKGPVEVQTRLPFERQGVSEQLI